MADEPGKAPAVKQPAATLRYIDRLECAEVFAD